MCRKPNYARAVLKAVASGDPESVSNVVTYQGRINGLIIAALRGVGRLTFSDATTSPPTLNEKNTALMLQHIWFASLVGWSAGLHSQSSVVEQMKIAAEMIVADSHANGA